MGSDFSLISIAFKTLFSKFRVTIAVDWLINLVGYLNLSKKAVAFEQSKVTWARIGWNSMGLRLR